MTYTTPDSNLLYLTNLTKSGIAGYEDLQKPPLTAGSEVELTQAVASSDGEVLLKAFVSPALGVETIPAGDWTFSIYGAVSAADGVSELDGHLYQRTLAGVETQILTFTTGEIEATTDTPTLYTTTYSTTDAVTTAITDRLVLKMYAKTDYATNITVSLFYLGVTHQSRFTIPTMIAKITGGDMLAALYDPDYDGITATSSDTLTAHSHSGSSDGGLIRLDTITAPTDSTSLDSSTDMHGLLAKLSGSSDDYMDGTGAWSTITVAASGHTIQDESTDLPDETYLNFIGAGVTAYDCSSDTSSKVEVDFNIHSNEIVAGKTLTIDAGTTAIVGGPLTISGDLVLNGSMVIL
jgi:hypothetical protein